MLIIGVNSEDVQLCNQLAVMCHENNFKIIFLNQEEELVSNLDYVVVDIDLNMSLAIDMCKQYSEIDCKIFAVTAMPTKSTILEAKEAGCLMVLTKSNFAANLADIINRSK